MGNKERRHGLVNRRIIKHGPDKGRVDMSAGSSEAKILREPVDVQELLQAIRQEQPSYKSRRYRSPSR